MEIKKIICKSGKEYNIVNEYWETSNSWGHKSTLLANYGEIETNKVRYINRTWECYKYQTCMGGLLYQIIEDNYKKEIERYKTNNKKSRLTQAEKDTIKAKMVENEYFQDLLEIKDRIETRKFD